MKFLHLFILSIVLGCGTTTKKNTPVISSDPAVNNDVEEVIIEPEVIEPVMPLGAVPGNYDGTNTAFYAHVKPSPKGSKTTIYFEDPNVPQIKIADTYGAKLYNLKFEEFDRDLLLVAAKMKDPIFIKYHLYTYRNRQWKPVITPFTLHISHTKNDFIPIAMHIENPNLITRHYSVFDLDQESEAGFTWRLLMEDVDILNK